MVSLLHLFIGSHCSLYYGSRTMSSSLRSSGGEPQASIHTPYHLSGNRPFIDLLIIIFMAFYFFILRPFYKWSRNIIIEILIIRSHYRVSLLHLTIRSHCDLFCGGRTMSSSLRSSGRAAGEHIHTLTLIGKSPFYRLSSYNINHFYFFIIETFL